MNANELGLRERERDHEQGTAKGPDLVVLVTSGVRWIEKELGEGLENGQWAWKCLDIERNLSNMSCQSTHEKDIVRTKRNLS